MGDDSQGVGPTQPIESLKVEPGASDARMNADEILRRLRVAQSHPIVSEGFLAEGGMGSIDRAHDRVIGRQCVIKRIRHEMADDERALRLFIREAQITGQLEHPSICPVYDLREVDGSVRFTMKLIDGRTLEDLVMQFPAGPLASSALFDLLSLVIRACEALGYAHSRGVTHCDIKPANIMVGDFGQVYVMDWGVARVRGEPGPNPAGALRRAPLSDPFGLEAGNATLIVGTPSFMPPEQARSEPVDARTDVWAVGALLYFILTRRAPYTAETVIGRMQEALEAQPTPVHEICGPGVVPWSLLRIIERAMSPDPEARFADAIELRNALTNFLRGEDVLPLVHFASGAVIVEEGASGAEAYLIRSGRALAYRACDGKVERLREMGPGEVFGEMALLSPGRRTASVKAIEPVAAHVISADVLDGELGALPPWLASVVRALAARFRESGR